MSTSSLLDLQRNLQTHLLGETSAIESAIDASEQIPAATRLQIYFDAYRLRLIEALEANFPVLSQALGEDNFSILAQRYLLTHPSQHYSIRWFGHRLANFIAAHEEYRDQTWMPELAEWEWSIASAFDASDASPVRIDAFVGIAPDEWPSLQFKFHPSLRRIAITTNIAAIVKASAKEEALPAPQSLGVRREWLIWRQDLTVQYRSLDDVEARALSAAMDGATFAEICERIAEDEDADATPLRAATFLKQWIEDECVIELRRA